MKTKVVIAGDFCPQNRVADLIVQGEFASLFGSIRDVIAQSDYSIVNLECPIAPENSTPIVKCGPLLKCDVQAVHALHFMGFKAVTLANNHFRDYGESGVLNTIGVLQREGFDYVGGGADIHEASRILYKTINNKCFAFINCCENEFSIASETKAGSNPLSITHQYRAIQEAKVNSEYVIVIVHGGAEGCQLPSPRMIDTYHFFVEAGADAVINHHQHCFSGFEYYRGKPICYGLGNFSFDKIKIGTSLSNICVSQWNEGYMSQLTFDGNSILIEPLPYIQGSSVPGTVLLDAEESRSIHNRILELNSIITSPESLIIEYNKWVDTHSDWYRIAFEPWGKGLRILRRKGLLPSLVSRKKWLSLADYMICETHHDHIKRYFYNLIERYNNQ